MAKASARAVEEQFCIDALTPDRAYSRESEILFYIPLPQLIEVARAAIQRQTAMHHAEQVNTDTLLNDALIALRATGKAEWL